MSNRAQEYREIIEDVVAHPELAEPDEWLQLRDAVARVIRKIEAKMPAEKPAEADHA